MEHQVILACRDGNISRLKEIDDIIVSSLKNYIDTESFNTTKICDALYQGLKDGSISSESVAIKLLKYLTEKMDIPIYQAMMINPENPFLTQLIHNFYEDVLTYMLSTNKITPKGVKKYFENRRYLNFPIIDAVLNEKFELFEFCFTKFEYPVDTLYNSLCIFKFIFEMKSDENFYKFANYIFDDLNIDVFNINFMFFKEIIDIFTQLINNKSNCIDQRMPYFFDKLKIEKDMFSDSLNIKIIKRFISSSRLLLDMGYTKEDVTFDNNKLIKNLMIDNNIDAVKNLCDEFNLSKDDVPFDDGVFLLKCYKSYEWLDMLFDKLKIDETYIRQNESSFLLEIINDTTKNSSNIYDLIINKYKFFNKLDLIKSGGNNIEALKHLLSIGILSREDFMPTL